MDNLLVSKTSEPKVDSEQNPFKQSQDDSFNTSKKNSYRKNFMIQKSFDISMQQIDSLRDDNSFYSKSRIKSKTINSTSVKDKKFGDFIEFFEGTL